MADLPNTLTDLKRELQADDAASKVEKLAAALIGRLLGISVAVADASFNLARIAAPLVGKGADSYWSVRSTATRQVTPSGATW
jgi:hypothetical protein